MKARNTDASRTISRLFESGKLSANRPRQGCFPTIEAPFRCMKPGPSGYSIEAVPAASYFGLGKRLSQSQARCGKTWRCLKLACRKPARRICCKAFSIICNAACTLINMFGEHGRLLEIPNAPRGVLACGKEHDVTANREQAMHEESRTCYLQGELEIILTGSFPTTLA